MSTLIATEADAEDVRRRIAEATGTDAAWFGVDFKKSIVMVPKDDGKGVMVTNYIDDQNCWYTQHLWGSIPSCMSLIKETVQELIRRGDGARRVRWSDASARPLLAAAVARKLPARRVWDGQSNKEVWEFTANEALPHLRDVG